jgi:hypothetical protein
LATVFRVLEAFITTTFFLVESPAILFEFSLSFIEVYIMEKISATFYNTIDPYQWITDIAHNETFKKMHLIDMVVVAKKNE